LFFTYLWRELRRRMRQAIFIAIGLALGIGLVITVTAASAGVKNAQSDVLHALYGVGTDITVTKAPAAGASGNGFGFGFQRQNGFQNGQKTGAAVSVNTLSSSGQLSSITSSQVSSISKLPDVAAVAGGLTLNDRSVSGTATNTNGTAPTSGSRRFSGTPGQSGSFGGNFSIGGFSVTGVDLANGELGPLSSQSVASGRTFTAADSSSNVALLDADYATQEKLKVGGTISIGSSKSTGTSFKIVGIVSSSGANPSDVYIPLGRAQALANLKDDVNTIYVAASSANSVNSVASEISKTVSGSTVTTSADLASEITGSLSTTASLANNLGKWLAILALIAAFLLASLLTMAAVTRRIREFGTLKALGWRSGRIVGQVMGESIAIGVIGGAIGVGLGFLGAALVGKFSGPLTATVGSGTGSATPGGSQFFNGGAPGGGTGGFPGGGGGYPGGGSGYPSAGSGTAGSGRFGFARDAANAAHTVAVHLTAPVTVEAVVAAVALAILGGLIAGSFGGWRAASLRPAAALSKVA
jgi:putative ABC transport system permease protein